MALNDFSSAIRQIAAERGLDVNEVVEAIKHAIRVGFKRDYPEEQAEALDVDIDMENGNIAVYADKKVVDEVTHPPTQVALDDAHKLEPRLKLGDHVLVEVTHTGDFGRVAAQAARQVIMQLVREAEKEAVLRQFKDKMGTVDTAIVQRMDRDGNVLLEINRAMAKMLPGDQIPGEFYRSADRIKVLLKKIDEDAKGKILMVSRSDPAFLKALFEMEVPEIASGTVEIVAIAREPGSRSKVAVSSNAEGVDPIGACVGQRGARINAITNELKGVKGEEKIDIILWDNDIATFIANAIRPAEALDVKIVNNNAKQALIIVNDEDLSLAIGREGQNVRLAHKLTNWQLDIQGQKAYDEGGKLSTFEKEDKGGKPPKKTKTAAKGKESEIATLGLSTRVVKAIEKAGIVSLAELKAKVSAGEAITGIGPKALEEIKAVI